MGRSIRPAYRESGWGRIRSITAAYTWHTSLDTYERIIEDDAKKSAIVIAAAVYHLAMRDELLPRFTKEQMPPLPPSRQQSPQAEPATPRPERDGR